VTPSRARERRPGAAAAGRRAAWAALAVRAARAAPTARAALGIAVLVAACAGPGGAPEEGEAQRLRAWLERSLEQGPAPDPGALEVVLAFAPDVDLDLYVTDPLQETVYFANSPSRAGGRLEADVGCAGRGREPRAETVRFAEPPPGRYRVSVDHPRSCGRARAAGYAVAVRHGGRVTLHTGAVRPLEFRLVALESEVRAGAAR